VINDYLYACTSVAVSFKCLYLLDWIKDYNNLFYLYFHFNTFYNVKIYNPLEFQRVPRAGRRVLHGKTEDTSAATNLRYVKDK
jgi:hypothetical protein